MGVMTATDARRCKNVYIRKNAVSGITKRCDKSLEMGVLGQASHNFLKKNINAFFFFRKTRKPEKRLEE